MHEENKTLIRRFVAEILNAGNPAAAEVLLAANFVFHFPGRPGPTDREGFLQSLAPFRAGFPDIRFTIEDLVAEGDRVAARFHMTGTHQGDFQGIAPTGRQAQWGGIALFRISEGRIAEEWAMPDVFGLLRQLGVPLPGSNAGGAS